MSANEFVRRDLEIPPAGVMPTRNPFEEMEAASKALTDQLRPNTATSVIDPKQVE